MPKIMANSAINTIKGMAHSGLSSLGKTGVGAYLGADVASKIISGEIATNGFLSGIGKWIGSGNTIGQKVARAGVAYVGAMATGRVISGGGLYRDRSGRFNVIGVPFI